MHHLVSEECSSSIFIRQSWNVFCVPRFFFCHFFSSPSPQLLKYFFLMYGDLCRVYLSPLTLCTVWWRKVRGGSLIFEGGGINLVILFFTFLNSEREWFLFYFSFLFFFFVSFQIMRGAPTRGNFMRSLRRLINVLITFHHFRQRCRQNSTWRYYERWVAKQNGFNKRWHFAQQQIKWKIFNFKIILLFIKIN